MDRLGLSLCLFLLAAASNLAGQSTGTPIFAAPIRAFGRSELGVSLSFPRGAKAVEGFYKVGGRRWDLGVRLGAQGEGGGGTFLAGLDLRGRVLAHGRDLPLDGSFTIGAGGLFADGSQVFLVPIGLSLGRRLYFDGSAMSLAPYFQPVITPVFGGGEDLRFTLGLGVDLRVSRRLDLRVAGAFGDGAGLGLSAAWLRGAPVPKRPAPARRGGRR